MLCQSVDLHEKSASDEHSATIDFGGDLLGDGLGFSSKHALVDQTLSFDNHAIDWNRLPIDHLYDIAHH